MLVDKISNVRVRVNNLSFDEDIINMVRDWSISSKITDTPLGISDIVNGIVRDHGVEWIDKKNINIRLISQNRKMFI